MTDFDSDNRLEQWKKAKQRRLDSYGWVDRQKALIHEEVDESSATGARA